jgi:hypothetical protein
MLDGRNVRFLHPVVFRRDGMWLMMLNYAEKTDCHDLQVVDRDEQQ